MKAPGQHSQERVQERAPERRQGGFFEGSLPKGKPSAGSLRARQQALLASLFSDAGDAGAAGSASASHSTGSTSTDEPAEASLQAWLEPPHQRGLMVYRANGHALAQRALAAAYPVLAQLVGPESFDDLACALWHADPPSRGDIGLWGEGLADFVEHDPQLSDVPYLADVARLEWLLHCCERAHDRPLDAHSLQSLLTEDPAGLSLVLCSGIGLLHSAWPVVSIVQCHRAAAPGEPVDLQGVQALMQSHTGEAALVWREAYIPRLRVLPRQEHQFLQALSQGLSLTQALDAAPAFDFEFWLPRSLASGLLRGVCALGSEPPEASSQQAPHLKKDPA